MLRITYFLCYLLCLKFSSVLFYILFPSLLVSSVFCVIALQDFAPSAMSSQNWSMLTQKNPLIFMAMIWKFPCFFLKICTIVHTSYVQEWNECKGNIFVGCSKNAMIRKRGHQLHHWLRRYLGKFSDAFPIKYENSNLRRRHRLMTRIEPSFGIHII